MSFKFRVGVTKVACALAAGTCCFHQYLYTKECLAGGISSEIAGMDTIGSGLRAIWFGGAFFMLTDMQKELDATKVKTGAEHDLKGLCSRSAWRSISSATGRALVPLAVISTILNLGIQSQAGKDSE